MPIYSQAGRLISVTTPLGEDKLLLTGFTGREAISRLFSFHLQTLSEDAAIDFTDVIGQSVTINVLQSDSSQRYFNGIVSHFACTGTDGDMTRYELEVVPKLWALTRYADCRIFHNKDVTQIVKQILTDRGIDFQASLTGTYKPLEYTVQYRETDFNFISRLMEQYGIFYFFQHGDGKHTMMLGDSSSVHQPCPAVSSFGYNLAAGGLDAGDVVNSWSIGQDLLSGKQSLTDYNFTTPSSDLSASESTIYTVGGNDAMEVFDYPGPHATQADGTALAKLRMQEEEAVHKVAQGAGVCRPFTTGYKFTLQDHPTTAMNAEYLLTEIQHVASVAGTYREEGGTGNDSYANHFACIPADVPFRPARLTPKPFVQGVQTAKVVNQNPDADGAAGSGEEIWVDKYGRVVVLFPWDRAGKSSCWVRVSQDWAGQGWGAITIPRVGQEVIVSFLEGDPDRPIITGRVYNADQTVPYALPANQTRSTFMTRSSKGGSSSTYNELRFEDLTGKEQVFLRAQFDQDNQVLHDSREAVGNNRSLTVAKDQLESVGGDLHTQVTGGVFETVGKDVNTKIGGKVVEKVGGDSNSNITGNFIEKIGGDANSNVTGNINQKAGQNISIQAGQNLYEKSGMNFAHEAGMEIHLKGGTNVTIEAGVMLTLKAGSNFIVIGPTGVMIVGSPMVMINSGGSAGSGCGSSPTDPTSPADPVAPTDPDKADDGKTGTKLGSGSSPAAASSPSSGGAAGSSPSAPAGLPAQGASPAAGAAGAAGALAGAAGAASSAAGQAEQAAQQAVQQAAQGAQQAAGEAQQAATQAEQAAQQAEQQAQQAVNQVTQQAKQAYNQANQAVQQAQQAVSQAAAQGQAAAQQALSQAEQQAQQATNAAKQAVQQAQQQAQQVEQQAQQAAAQAQQAAQQAEQQAQQAAAQAQQQAKQAVQQGQQAAQQAAQQAQQAAQQAQQQAQQAAQQAQQAANQAKQTAQQAAQQVQQAASQAQQQAQKAAQGAQQSASQAISQAQRGI